MTSSCRCLLLLRGVQQQLHDHVAPLPRQRWTAIFPCIGKWSAIGSHLIVAQLAQYRSRQEVFNEHILLEHHCLAILAAKSLEDGSLIFRPILPGNGLNKRLHVADTLDALDVLARPIEA